MYLSFQDTLSPKSTDLKPICSPFLGGKVPSFPPAWIEFTQEKECCWKDA